MVERKNSNNNTAQQFDNTRGADAGPEWLQFAAPARGSASARKSVREANGGIEFKITPELMKPLNWRKSNHDDRD